MTDTPFDRVKAFLDVWEENRPYGLVQTVSTLAEGRDESVFEDYLLETSDLRALVDEVERLRPCSLLEVWAQAQQNHERYSATGSIEDDIRFFGLGLAGEAGEVANFIKKRWRDGDSHDDALRKECADVMAYTMMLAWKLGMSPADLVAMITHKQAVFIEKMEAKKAPILFSGPMNLIQRLPSEMTIQIPKTILWTIVVAWIVIKVLESDIFKAFIRGLAGWDI